MILFVGEKEKGFYVDEIATKYNETVFYTGYTTHIKTVKEDMIKEKYSHIIIECEQLIDDYNTITNELNSIKTVTGANIIIMCIGFDIRTELIQTLAQNGYRNFITATVLSKQKEQLENCINNVNSVLDDTTLIEDTAEPSERTVTPKKEKSYKIIAFGGCTARIGTTTQAIQFIKYLHFLGYKACYIEMNNNGFVNDLTKIFEIESEDKEIGKISYMGVDLFNKKENISQILKLDYDYFIYDFGSFEDKTFNAISFMEKDICVCVCGTNANEMNSTNNLIMRTYNSDVFYLFNFCHENERQDVLELMNSKAEKTIFTEYTPDCFTYVSRSNDIYNKILHLQTTEPHKKKKGLFKRW